MVRRLILVSICCALIAAGAVALAACDSASTDVSPTVDDERVLVQVGDKLTIAAEVALTPAQRTLGLGGREAIDIGAGMLFVFREAGTHTFCMCGMRFPLDFVWIGPDLRVVDFSRAIPPPDETNGEPETITPAQPVLYVLEVNAGLIDDSGLQVGDPVTFLPAVSPEQAS